MRKQFDPTLFNKYDQPAKLATIKLYNQMGIEGLIPHPNPKSADFVLYANDDLVGLVECEVKLGFKGSVFKFPTVHIALRKTHYVDCTFLIWNAECTSCVAVSSDVFPKCIIVDKETKYGLDSFVEVPVAFTKIYHLEESPPESAA